eukprot:767446-Hanusia_phi.AAC.5
MSLSLLKCSPTLTSGSCGRQKEPRQIKNRQNKGMSEGGHQDDRERAETKTSGADQAGVPTLDCVLVVSLLESLESPKSQILQERSEVRSTFLLFRSRAPPAVCHARSAQAPRPLSSAGPAARSRSPASAESAPPPSFLLCSRPRTAADRHPDPRISGKDPSKGCCTYQCELRHGDGSGGVVSADAVDSKDVGVGEAAEVVDLLEEVALRLPQLRHVVAAHVVYLGTHGLTRVLRTVHQAGASLGEWHVDMLLDLRQD